MCCVTENFLLIVTPRTRLDASDAQYCWRRNLDGLSASWGHEDDFGRLVTVQREIVMFGPHFDVFYFCGT